MTDSEADKMAAGERLFHTVEHGDLEDLRSIFADGAMVWHNTDEALTDVETTIRNLRAIREPATVFHYDSIRRAPTPSGFVQRSEERRVGKEGVRTWRSRWSPYH